MAGLSSSASFDGSSCAVYGVLTMIEIKNVSFAYRVSDAEGKPVLRSAVKDLNLTIHGGEFIVLTGSSGCGKTTVCRLINGLIPHYFEGERQGEVLIEGTDVAKEPI